MQSVSARLSDFSQSWSKKRCRKQDLAAEIELEICMDRFLTVLNLIFSLFLCYLENLDMYRDFQECLQKGDGNHNAIRELVYLYNQWQQAYIWNCLRYKKHWTKSLYF